MKKLAIVGFANSTRDKAPFNDSEYEIWGLNHLYPYIPRWDRWFELHDIDWMKSNLTIWKEYDEWLRKDHPFPIYMQDHYPEYPSSVKFPIESLVDRYGSYYTSTISMMIAFAIYSGFEHIEIYGVDLTHDTEWGIQRPCVEYWIGIARGLGITVGLPDGCALMSNDGIYGYNENSIVPELRKIEEYLSKQALDMRSRRESFIKDAHTADGALQAFDEALGSIRQFMRGRPLFPDAK